MIRVATGEDAQRATVEARFLSSQRSPGIPYVIESFANEHGVFAGPRGRQVRVGTTTGAIKTDNDSIRRFLIAGLRVLERLHARGFSHLTISPDTIFWDGSEAVGLIDFDGAVDDRHLFTSPGFASPNATGPEQDLYGLVATAVFLGTGEAPSFGLDGRLELKVAKRGLRRFIENVLRGEYASATAASAGLEAASRIPRVRIVGAGLVLAVAATVFFALPEERGEEERRKPGVDLTRAAWRASRDRDVRLKDDIRGSHNRLGVEVCARDQRYKYEYRLLLDMDGTLDRIDFIGLRQSMLNAGKRCIREKVGGVALTEVKFEPGESRTFGLEMARSSITKLYQSR